MSRERTSQNKPRLIFFQYKYDERLPAFLRTHKREHAECLSHFFEVTVIEEDCDYQQVCDEHRPDVVLFESGVPNPACRRPDISNIRACPEIPKLGFLHSDGFSAGRAGFLSDMDHWGIETFFAIATTAAEHIPEIAQNLFIWPNFIDPTIYHDYGQCKNIPVLFTGNTNDLYPWRQKIIKLVPEQYPSLICPHPGYAAARGSRRTGKALTRVPVGEPYARMLNASWCVPACGAVAKEVVRKHLEIPGCKSCLIAEKSVALEAAGFVDMNNCVFADEHDILDKLDFLFDNPDLLRGIISAGHELVHSRHTVQHRNQVFQWLNLYKDLKPGQKIIQPGPFEPLRIVEEGSRAGSSHISCDGLHLRLLHEGDQKLWAGDYRTAEKLYSKCLSYISYMPEPKLRLALCSLYAGNAKKALGYILPPIQFTIVEYGANDPDPVEWAYFVVSLLCAGKVEEAVRRAGEFPWLRHPELDRVRWAINGLSKRPAKVPSFDEKPVRYRFTIHQLPGRNLQEWTNQICVMLKACGQADHANRLKALAYQERECVARSNDGSTARQEANFPARKHTRDVFTFFRNDAFGFFSRRRFYSSIRFSVEKLAKSLIYRLEAKYGRFLTHHVSTQRSEVSPDPVQDDSNGGVQGLLDLIQSQDKGARRSS
jgi:hypothetical protein